MIGAPTAAAPQWAHGLLDGLNDAQREAARAVTGPVCILAGAGTGKTRTITRRVANQVATGVARPDQVLAVTFTERAANELRVRLAALGMPGAVRAATFHAAAWAQLRHFWSSIDGGPLPEVITSKVPLLMPTARKLKVQASDLAVEIEWAKARSLTPEAYGAAARGRDLPVAPSVMAQVYEAYESAKARAGQIDYDDMLLRTTAALHEHPEVRDAVRDRYRFFTIDEFQDVNPAQWALLRAWLGDGDQVCVVGDDDQSIYAFTGATAAYLTGFRRHFADARTVTLTENYRSTPQVLALANRALADKPKALRKTLVSRVADGPDPILRGFDDAEGERTAVLAEIRRLVAAGVPYGEMAICYRVNAQSEPLEETLAEAEIPFVVRADGGGFFARREVRQALAAIARSAAAGGPPPPSDAPPPDGAEPVGPPRADRDVERILREQLSWHPRREPAGATARERWRNIGAVADLAARLVAAQPDLTLTEISAELDRRAQAGDDHPGELGAVTLMTLHKAKGLEFDAVFMIALEEGLLPISHAKTHNELAEERRLLYVGLTRARRHLWVSWAGAREGRSGRSARRRPSRFLSDLGVALQPASGRRARRRTPDAAGDADPQLIERLRAWRLDRSRRDGVPAFVVFGDRTMHELAERAPATCEELLDVSGFGPVKVDRYGDEVLAVLRDTAEAST